MSLVLRNETQSDYREVEEMTRDAFWNLYVPGCDEHYLSHILRDHEDFVKELDFIAVEGEKIVGSIMYTRSYVEDENGQKMETLSFGPLCVRPGYQRKGVGRALINHTKKLALEMGIPAILIYGSPHNYCVHGFKNGKDYGVSDVMGRYPYGMLVLELRKGCFDGHQWKLYQSKVFEFSAEAVEEFDKQFEPKEKGYQYSQVEFSMSCRAFLD